MLGSTGPWSFCCRLGGAAGSQPQCGATALLLLLPRRFLFHFPSSCYVVIITHTHAARRGVTRRAVTTSIETVAVIATGGRPIAESSDLRRRSAGAARCSTVTRDGGGCGMVAAAGRGCQNFSHYSRYGRVSALFMGRPQVVKFGCKRRNKKRAKRSGAISKKTSIFLRRTHHRRSRRQWCNMAPE